MDALLLGFPLLRQLLKLGRSRHRAILNDGWLLSDRLPQDGHFLVLNLLLGQTLSPTVMDLI